MWTLDELVERVREALVGEYPGAPNGRVRDVPDRRAIRWYTTIGLVDRPLGMRGRTALYGPRHLQQLVALKRRQAEGRSLAQIQAEFTWLSPEGLTDASRVPVHLLDAGDGPDPDDAGPVRRHFWTDRPTTITADPAIATPLSAAPTAAAPPTTTPPTTTPPTTTPPTTAPPATAPASARPPTATPALATTASPASAPPAMAPATSAPATPQATPPAVLHGLALGGGAVLLLPRPAGDGDRTDIAAAAAPLLDLLASRGLIDGRKP
jgi:DNA-binding transcriptional MerR regulator